VWENSPASKSGIVPGDIILKIDEFIITDDQIIKGVLQEFRTNQTVSVEILRDGKEITKKMKLERQND
jgi:S1-C subfamily serine protease